MSNQPRITELSYERLSQNYPLVPGTDPDAEPIGGLCQSYSNQCAIRLSRALHHAGLTLGQTNYADPTCRADGIAHARGAQSLADHLWRVLGPPRKVPASSDLHVRGRKGIIFFKDISGFREGIGDHIDLWDGHSTKGYNGFGSCREVWFWSLPRRLP